MKCSCCAKKRKVFESFEQLGVGGEVCAQCSDLMYRVQDAYTEGEKETFNILVERIRDYETQKKSSGDFIKWFNEIFLDRFDFEE